MVCQLLEWGEKSLERVSNQAMLPHAIIVLNQTDTSTPDEEWDILSTTQWLFESMDKDLHNNARLKNYLNTWKDRGTDISRFNTEDLLRRYYTTVRVVRIPELPSEGGRPNLIRKQVRILYTEIAVECNQVTKRKSKLRMLLDADQLQPYLHLAFDHFSSEDGLHSPFDFIQASFYASPISRDFCDNIKKVVLILRGRRMLAGRGKFDIESIFNELTNIIASCIMLDAARNKRLGDADAILPKYRSFYTKALEECCGMFCGYQGCINSRSTHAKGHQIRKGGKIVGAEDLEFMQVLDTNHFAPQWEENVKKQLAKLLSVVEKKSEGHADVLKNATIDLHKKEIRAFYNESTRAGANRANSFVDHSGCLSCLMGTADHCLPCGHALCTACVCTFANLVEPTVAEIKQCPLHSHNIWEPGKLVTLKPALAGIRMMSLDG
jgi:hypothetical protein